MTKLMSVLLVTLFVGCADTPPRDSREAEVAALRTERDALAKEVAALKAARATPSTSLPMREELKTQRAALLKVYATCEAPCARQFTSRIDDLLQRWEITAPMLNACVRRCEGHTVAEKDLVTHTTGEGDAGEPVTPAERDELLQLFKRCKAPCANDYVKHPETIKDEDARRCFMMECSL